jgi:hypothetical protein
MRIRRTDDNQKKLVAQIRAIPGTSVAHTHTLGQGFPDLCVSYKGVNFLFEVKDPLKPPSARKLTPDEQKFHESWTGSIHVVETIDDVFKIFRIAI